MRHSVRHWIAAGFCAFISLIALVASVGNAESWRPAFFAFLPMCFYFVAIVTTQMQVEIRELRNQLAELQAK